MKAPATRDLAGVDVAVVGAPFDSGGAIRVGARFGPGAIREQSKLYLRRHHRVRGFSPFDRLRVVDYGDAEVIPELIERSFAMIAETVAPIHAAGAVPLALGGDHAVTLPLLRAAAARHGPLALVHFDSHQDVVDSYYGGEVRYNNGTVFRRAVEEGLVDPAASIQLGMNGTVFPGMRPRDSEELGFRVVPVEELAAMSPGAVGAMIRERVAGRPAYVSFDIDVVDASAAPGTGAPEVGGLMPREVIAIVRALHGLDIRGLDLVEVNPLFDAANMTSLLAANLAFEFLTLIALARRPEEDA
jgi:agmatinase